MALTVQNVASDVMLVVNALVPVVEAADPSIGLAVSIGQKIVQGAIALEPTAVDLYNQIKKGTPPTATQLQDFQTAYEADYQQLNSDINARLSKLG